MAKNTDSGGTFRDANTDDEVFFEVTLWRKVDKKMKRSRISNEMTKI